MPNVRWDDVPSCLLAFVTHRQDQSQRTQLKWCISARPSVLKQVLQHELLGEAESLPAVQFAHLMSSGKYTALTASWCEHRPWSISHTDEDGNTALHIACEKGRSTVLWPFACSAMLMHDWRVVWCHRCLHVSCVGMQSGAGGRHALHWACNLEMKHEALRLLRCQLSGDTSSVGV